jgi:hypothetical protein
MTNENRHVAAAALLLFTVYFYLRLTLRFP